MHITTQLNITRRYCVIINVSQFCLLILSYICPIPDLYSEISALYAKIPALYAEIPAFYADIYIFLFHCASNVCGHVPIVCHHYASIDSERVMSRQRGRVGACWWRKNCTSVCAKLFWCGIYFSKPRPNTKSQPGSHSRRGLGRQSPRIMQ